MPVVMLFAVGHMSVGDLGDKKKLFEVKGHCLDIFLHF